MSERATLPDMGQETVANNAPAAADAPATPEKKLGGVTGRGFLPGQSGNPTGRAKGVAAKARELIKDDPSRLLNVFLEIADNEKAKPADRVSAAREYLDRAYGKAPAFAPIDGENPLDLETLQHVRELVDDLARKRAARPSTKAASVAATGNDSPAEMAERGSARAASS